MDTSRRTRARPIAVVAALLLVVLSMGVSGSALADPGNGKGAGQANNQAKSQADGASSQAASSGSSAGTSDAAPSQSDAETDTTGDGTGPAAASNAKPAKSNAKPAKPNAKPAKSTKSTSKGSTSKGSSDHSQGNAGTTGDVTQPQPLSHADQNSGGANGKCPGGPYCSTRDGSPSMNGNGGGKSLGKPCAGCVGKADNKNPKGQYPNGSDHNAGYECDTNHGIGRSNPAHTGCVTAPPPGCVPQPGQDENCQPIGECVPTAGQDENCQPVEECVPTAGQDENCQPVEECVPTAGQDENCQPVEECVPTAGQDENCQPAEGCVAGTDEDCTDTPTANRPPVVLGTEAFATPPGSTAPASVKGAAGVLPATGAGASLGLLGIAGLGMVLVGAATMLMRRRPAEG